MCELMSAINWNCIESVQVAFLTRFEVWSYIVLGTKSFRERNINMVIKHFAGYDTKKKQKNKKRDCHMFGVKYVRNPTDGTEHQRIKNIYRAL